MNTATHPLGGIILAAGSSRRFGEDKRLTQVASGRTMLAESIHQAAEVLDQLVVVLRFGDGRLAEDLNAQLANDYPDKTIRCYCAPDSAKGMAHSLANAVHLMSDWQAVAVFLGDMPYVAIETIEALVRSYQEHKSESPIVLPVKNDRQGHPVIFHHNYFEEIEALEGDTGARPVIDAHKDKVIEIPVDDTGIFIDVDLPEDLGGRSS